MRGLGEVMHPHNNPPTLQAAGSYTVIKLPSRGTEDTGKIALYLYNTSIFHSEGKREGIVLTGATEIQFYVIQHGS